MQWYYRSENQDNIAKVIYFKRFLRANYAIQSVPNCNLLDLLSDFIVDIFHRVLKKRDIQPSSNHHRQLRVEHPHTLQNIDDQEVR